MIIIYLNFFCYKSELDTYFEWDIKEPFSFSPVNGELKSNSSIDITVTFEPKVYQLINALFDLMSL